jgi:flagellin-specific chaperone FliS
MKLVHVLYEQALLEVRAARAANAGGDTGACSHRVTRALTILRELDGKAGRPANLAVLYEYMQRRLTEGLISLRDEPLAEVESLMRTLNEGLTAMAQAPNSNLTSAPPAFPVARA